MKMGRDGGKGRREREGRGKKEGGRRRGGVGKGGKEELAFGN